MNVLMTVLDWAAHPVLSLLHGILTTMFAVLAIKIPCWQRRNVFTCFSVGNIHSHKELFEIQEIIAVTVKYPEDVASNF